VPGLAGAESPAAGGIPALWLLPLLPAAWVVGWLSWRNLAWAFGSGMLVLRWGIVGQYRAFVPTRRIQSVLLTAGPLQRLLGLATITVHVAGGSPTSLADLPRGDAEHLRARLASEAAVAARHEWPARRAAVLAAAPAPA
jgi:membrane protein YdbS with pleckstrin-like domain